MSTSASTSTSTSPPIAGPSSQVVESTENNTDEKNRCVEPCRSIAVPWLIDTSSVVIKVGMVGDSQIGKTSLMVKYVEGSFDEDYIQTLGE